MSDDQKVLIVTGIGRRKEVMDFSPAAAGMSQGTPLSVALSRFPTAIQVEADLARYQKAFEDVLQALGKVSPVVDAGKMGVAYVSLDGLAPMYGGREEMLRALRQAVPGRLQPRFGIAGGKFPATIAAYAAQPIDMFFAPYDVAGFLAPYPVRVLPISYELRTRLEHLGLRTLGDIARQHLGPMQAHFGKEGKFIWELAHGVDRRPLQPRRDEPQVVLNSAFANPTVVLDVILLTVEHLLKKGFLDKKLRGRYVRTILLDMRLSRRAPWHRRISYKEVVGSAGHALPRIKHALTLVPPPGPVEEIGVTLTGITGEAGRQASLLTDVRKQEQLRQELMQLEARLGKRAPIYHIRDAEPWSRMPERRRVLVEYVP